MFKKKQIKKTTWVFFIVFFFLFTANSLLWAQEEDMYQGLPPGNGRDLVLNNCTACHSAAIILENHMTRDAWDKTLTWMQQKQGMWELEANDRKTILDYLANQQGSKHQEAQHIKKRKNPMYEFDYRPNPL